MSVGIVHPGLVGKSSRKPFIIGVAGGTSSGKTSVCEKILELLGESSAVNGSRKVAIISQDDFYKVLEPDDIQLANKSQYNFDHPNAFDTALMKEAILDISNGKTIQIPEYDFKTHTRRKDFYDELHPCDVVLFEGILVFYHKEIRDLFDMKLFVDSDADTRLSRRVLRDTCERGRTLESVLQQYTTFVKPAFEEYCLPTKKYADVIIPRGSENFVAINLIVQHIRDILNGDIMKKCQTNGISSKMSNGIDGGSHANGDHPLSLGKTLISARPH